MTSSTLSLDEAAGTLWDSIIIGAGPAGSVAARQLAVDGRNVLLVDRKAFPRPKVCGTCLNARAIQTLRNLGITAVEDLPHIPTERLEIASSDMRVNLKAAYGIAVSRTLMDVALIESAIHRGTAFLPEATALVSPINDLGDTREVQISFGEKTVLAQTRTIVCADGLQNSSLRRLTDLSTHVSADSHVGVGGSLAQCPGSIQPQTIHMALHNQGYVGMVRLVDNSLNLAAAINPAFLKSHDSVSAAIADIVQRVGFHELTEEFLNGATWLGTTPLTHSPTRLHDHRLLIVGDAAGYIEPFTGEGMAWGITGGVSASRIVDQHLESWDESANRNWERSYQRIVGSRRFWCRSIASALRRPWLVKSILRVLNCAPFLTTPMIRSINRMPTDLQEVEGQSAQKKSPLNERAS